MGPWLVALLLTAGLAAPGGASTFFYARGEGSDLVGQEAIPPRFYDESTAFVRVQGDPADVVQFTVRGVGNLPWHVILYGPVDGGPIVPGTYESTAGDPTPVVVVSGNERTCSAAAARVTVHAIEVTDDAVSELTLDFEQHCSDDPASGLFGSVRYGTGRDTCDAAADGTPCDDVDACTAEATCVGGECLPTTPREPCAAGEQCLLNGVCDPLTAVCSPAVPATSTPCDDGNACTTDDACLTGRCTGAFLTCDDASPCTTDTCDPATGCVHVPVAEQCWALAGRTVTRLRAAGRIGGRRIRCRARCMAITREVLLIDGDHYRFAAGPTECTSGTFDLTDEVGTLVPARRGQTAFEVGNVEQLRLELLACMRVQVFERLRVMTMAPGGASLTGRQQTRARVTQAIPTRVTITTEFNGLPYRPDALPEPPPPAQLLQNCEGGLPVQCRFELD